MRAELARSQKLIVTLLGLIGLVVASPTGHATEAESKVQPGAAILTESGSNCTLNWVFDGVARRAGQVFVGTAAHCVADVGESIQLQDMTLGTPIMVIGRVAFISQEFDYALIRVSSKHVNHVDPAMAGYPEIPTGVSTSDTAQVGDVIQFSGHGMGFHATQPTREERFGILHTISETWWSAAGPVTPGDSGGPAANVTDDNKALGVVDVVCAGVGCAGAAGVSIEAVLTDSAANGFTIKLRTVK